MTKDEQSVIALDLFKAVEKDFDRSVPVTMRQKNRGEIVFIESLREHGVAVQLVERDSDIRLDFYYFTDRGDYAGVVTTSKKRIVRRYAIENNTLILLSASVAWPGVSRE